MPLMLTLFVTDGDPIKVIWMVVVITRRAQHFKRKISNDGWCPGNQGKQWFTNIHETNAPFRKISNSAQCGRFALIL